MLRSSPILTIDLTGNSACGGLFLWGRPEFRGFAGGMQAFAQELRCILAKRLATFLHRMMPLGKDLT